MAFESQSAGLRHSLIGGCLAALAILLLLPSLAHAKRKVDVCHVDGSGKATQLVVSEKGADAHLAKHSGDSLGSCNVTTCSTDADCNDRNSCTTDVCGANGQCDHGWLLPVSQGPQIEKTIPVRYTEGSRNGEAVPQSYQWTRATPEGVHMVVETTNLRANETYTMWIAAYGDPEGCSNDPTLPDDLRCGVADLAIGLNFVAEVTGGHPTTDIDYVYGDGAVTDESGTARFEGCLPANMVFTDPQKVGTGDGVFGAPLFAEYQTVLRYHGPEDPRFMPEQVEEHDGGCSNGDIEQWEDGYECGFDQATGAAVGLMSMCSENSAEGCSDL